MRRYFCILVSTLLLGCTSTLIEGSKPKEVRVGSNDVALKLVSASILQDTGETPESHGYLCLMRTLLPDGPEKLVLVSLAPAYPFAQAQGTYFPFNEIDGQLVMETSGSRLFEGCESPRGKIFLEQLPIIEAKVDERLTLPENHKDAVVVSYQTPGHLGVGYISAAQIFGAHHSFTVDLSQSPVYTEYKGARPYLLLLTPVTVAGDAVLLTSLFFTMVTVGTVCPKADQSCR
jgi:hypothetical protein